MRRDRDPNLNVVGISPLGGNSIEGTGTDNAAIRDESVSAVPLVYDQRAGCYISEQAVDDLDDRDDSREKSKAFNDEQAFLTRIGVRKSIQS